jgi:acetyltransferase
LTPVNRAAATASDTPAVDYPAHLAREHRFADGRTVLIRPVRPDDVRRELAFLARLPPGARRMRFQRAAGAPDADLARFHAGVDYDRRMGFVAEAAEGDEETMVGEASYIAHADGESCELGIVVADGWRHSGLAQQLMAALIEAARAHGFARMEGSVLRGNADMLDFARSLGFRVDDAPEDEQALRITLPLRAAS